MKTGNKILLTGAAVLVASILVNIATVLHAYRTENAYTRHLDSLLQQRTIRVLVELAPHEGHCYHYFQTREEQENSTYAVTQLAFHDAPETPETARIEGDTLFICPPAAFGSFPHVTRFIRSDGQELDVHGLALTTKEIPRFKDREIN